MESSLSRQRDSLALAATASAGLIIAMTWLLNRMRQQWEKRDILQDILNDTAPVVAARELSREKEERSGSMSCERTLGGRQLIITADPKVADYIFNGTNKWNFVQP